MDRSISARMSAVEIEHSEVLEKLNQGTDESSASAARTSPPITATANATNEASCLPSVTKQL